MSDRKAQLEAIYLNITYFMVAEEKDPECSPAVLQACTWAKSSVRAEHTKILEKRGQVQS